ncbi:aspartic peptidase domain-containing protein [Zychaea mexicana]|uniref:aspartic peptidase domain-containing protein n=1 Tax=Zychaea mexicana TaxID=64656 RepID=UPI0022FDD342|nr:aspartic peptidase domain-containing protein [Zychaea mexicana]KAI9495151.1 aspartic peptidase domain-containing protein [Zychaea mexicana]
MRSLTLIATLALASSSALAAPFLPSLERRNTNETADELITIDMTYKNGLYAISLNVGTPPQTDFKVLFDTGSEVSWVPSSQCNTENCIQSSALYNPADSSTAFCDTTKEEKVEYEDGRGVSVQMYKDTVAFGNVDTSTPINFQNFPIGAATEVEGFDASDYLGFLGYGNQDALHSIISALEGVDGRLSKRSLGESSQTSGSFGGGTKRWDTKQAVFTFGIDPSRYVGEIAYFALPASEKECENHSIYWRTALKGVGLEGKYDCDLPHKSYAKFATGTRSIKAPPVHADILHLKFGAFYNIFKHRYEFKCSKLDSIPNLNFKFENYQISVPASLWTDRIDENDESEDAKCYTHIRRGSDRFKEWTLGTIVLDEFYQIWDHHMLRMGLAETVDGSDAKLTPLCDC